MKSTYSKRNGHERYKIVKKNNNKAAIDRRKKALEGLEEDIKTGRIRTGEVQRGEALTDVQKKRIMKEIETLKTKV